MVEQNFSGYNNAFKFNGKEQVTKSGMYYYGARYYDPKMSLFVSVDPLAEQFQGWSPYNYTMNNPLNLVDPTGMAPEAPDGPPPPKKGAKTDPITQGSYNVAKKYIGLGLSVAADPIGTAISVGKGLGQELSDFVGKDGARLDNTLLRKGGEAFDSYVSRVSGSSDPAYEHQVILAEMATEIAASALVTKGAGALIGKAGTGSVAAEASSINITRSPVIRSVDDIFADPGILQGKSLTQTQRALKGTPGWVEGSLKYGRSEGKGWTFRQMNSRGTDFTDKYIQYSPGSSRHFGGNPYWKFSSGKTRDLRFQASKLK